MLKGLHPETWAVHINPDNLPVQTDIESCGVFVLFVAEHFERGVRPSFKQSDIALLRFRVLSVLNQKELQDS